MIPNSRVDNVSKRIKKWWIKERHNPQTGVYYVACGQLSMSAASAHEKPIYGTNVMHSYHTEDQYKSRVKELEKARKLR